LPDLVNKIAEWGWLSLLAAIGYIWKLQVGHSKDNADKLKSLEDKLVEHTIDDANIHQEFVRHTYIESDMKPWFRKLEEKMDTLIYQTADVIKRDEYKQDITSLHEKIDGLEKRKVDK